MDQNLQYTPTINFQEHNKIKNFLPNHILLKIAFWVFWSLLALGLILVLQGYLFGIKQGSFAPRQKTAFDFSYSLETLKEVWPWIIGIVIGGSLATAWITKWKFFSKIIFIITILLTLFFSAAAYFVSIQPCEGLSCIGSAFSLLLAEASLLLFSGITPILYSRISNDPENFKLKRQVLAGIIIVIITSILYVLATSGLRAEFSKRESESKQKIETIYSDPAIPVYEPAYLPSSVTKLAVEDVDEARGSKFYRMFPPNERWERDWGNALVYTRQYLNEGVSSFIIQENVLQKPIDSKTYQTNDFKALQNEIAESLNHPDPRFREPDIENVEEFTINSYPVLFYFYSGNPMLHVYIEGIKIKIYVNPGGNILSKDELIKIAQSLKKIK